MDISIGLKQWDATIARVPTLYPWPLIFSYPPAVPWSGNLDGIGPVLAVLPSQGSFPIVVN